MDRRIVLLATTLVGALFAPAAPSADGSSLRFYGHGAEDVDRVKIPIDAPEVPADIGAGDFTIELWLKANPADVAIGACTEGIDGWIHGHIVLDRDIWGPGDYGDFGLSISRQGVAFGVANGQGWGSLCGQIPVADGQWHHVAVTRVAATGELRLFADGLLDAMAAGPSGNLNYRNGRPGYPNDPFLVLGAEKHDAGPEYPSFAGWLEELRLSTVNRYDVDQFPRPTGPFVPDLWTAALYHFDEGSGVVAADASGHPAGPSTGMLRVGGDPVGPAWSAETPFAGAGVPGDPPDDGNGGTCPDENCGMVFSDGPVRWRVQAAPNPMSERCVLTLQAHTQDGSLPVAPGSFAGAAADLRVPRSLVIHDATGRVVARLASDQTESAGGIPSLRFTWSGRDTGGRLVPSGVYWARVANDRRAGMRLLVLR